MVKKSLFTKHLPLKALLLALLLAFLMTGIAQAVIQNRKLSGEMSNDRDVEYFKLSPDGRYVVFTADARVDEQFELFSVPTIGGKRILLSSGLSSVDEVGNFFISPDSQWVVYYVASGRINPYQLFSIPIGGGEPVELYQAASEDYVFSDIKISPDSERVLFINTIEGSGGRKTLLSVPIGGGAISTISAPDDWCYIDYQITPDSQHVIYNQKETWCAYQGLFQSDLVGDDVIWLDDQFVKAFKITPNGEYVVFTQETIDAKIELFSIPVGGGGTETLNGTLLPGAKVSNNFDITPDSAYVIYVADERVLTMKDLFRAPVDGTGDAINMTPSMAVYGDVTSFQISPDSTWVVYRADQTYDGQFDLYSVPIEGLWGGLYPFKRLTKGMDADGDVEESRYEITLNSAGVVLIADFFTDTKKELFAADKTGSYRVCLNPDLTPHGDVMDFEISHNSLGVGYLADQEVDEVINLYIVPSTGGMLPIQVNPDLVEGGDVGKYYLSFSFLFTKDDKGIVYIADQEVDEMDELFITYDYQMVYMPLVMK